MKTERLLSILGILADTNKITTAALAERLEVSKRTIFRDLEALNLAGFPIVSYPGLGGGVGLTEGCKLDRQVLSQADKTNLFTALNGLMSIDKSNELIHLTAKITPDETSRLFSQSGYLIDFSSWFADGISRKKIEDLSALIKSGTSAEIEYIAKSGRTCRIVHPYKLIFKEAHWYLYAFCEQRQGFRLFNMKRIAKYKAGQQQFAKQAVAEIPLPKHFGKNLFAPLGSCGCTDVMLTYQKEDEFYLTDQFDASLLQREADAQEGRIAFAVSDLARITDFILNLQDKIRIIEPQTLKAQAKARAQKF